MQTDVSLLSTLLDSAKKDKNSKYNLNTLQRCSFLDITKVYVMSFKIAAVARSDIVLLLTS